MEAVNASGNCAMPQMQAHMIKRVLDDMRLARNPKPIAEMENSKKKLLAIMPNSDGDKPRSAINGLATSPRIALSMKLSTMNKASMMVMTQARGMDLNVCDIFTPR